LSEDYKIVLEKDGKHYVAPVSWVADKVLARLENQLKVIRETISVLRDTLHEELVQYFQKRILGILETSGKAWRYGDLLTALGPDTFWMQRHEALEALEKAGKVTVKRGWVKLAKKIEETSENE